MQEYVMQYYYKKITLIGSSCHTGSLTSRISKAGAMIQNIFRSYEELH